MTFLGQQTSPKKNIIDIDCRKSKHRYKLECPFEGSHCCSLYAKIDAQPLLSFFFYFFTSFEGRSQARLRLDARDPHGCHLARPARGRLARGPARARGATAGAARRTRRHPELRAAVEGAGGLRHALRPGEAAGGSRGRAPRGGTPRGRTRRGAALPAPRQPGWCKREIFIRKRWIYAHFSRCTATRTCLRRLRADPETWSGLSLPRRGWPGPRPLRDTTLLPRRHRHRARWGLTRRLRRPRRARRARPRRRLRASPGWRRRRRSSRRSRSSRSSPTSPTRARS